jgi:hypothetical protein
MPQPPTPERLTAGERWLADVIESSTKPRLSPSEKAAVADHPRVDLVWDADPDPQRHGTR